MNCQHHYVKLENNNHINQFGEQSAIDEKKTFWLKSIKPVLHRNCVIQTYNIF